MNCLWDWKSRPETASCNNSKRPLLAFQLLYSSLDLKCTKWYSLKTKNLWPNWNKGLATLFHVKYKKSWISTQCLQMHHQATFDAQLCGNLILISKQNKKAIIFDFHKITKKFYIYTLWSVTLGSRHAWPHQIAFFLRNCSGMLQT